MSDIKSRIVDAAIETFSQYGVKKTSMADIAQRAGVSRQTLYVNFESKDEMLAAGMQSVVDGMLAGLKAQWAQAISIEDILAVYFEIAVVGIYDMLQSKPDAKDLLLGVGELSNKVAIETDKKKIRLLTEQFQPYASQLESAGTDPKSVAQFIVSITGNLKYSVGTKRELNGLLHTLKQSVLAMTGSKALR